MILNDSEWFYIESAWFLNDSWMILTISPRGLHIYRGIDWFWYCCFLSHPGHWRAAKASVLWWLPGGRPGIPQLGVKHQLLPWLRQALTSFAGCESWSVGLAKKNPCFACGVFDADSWSTWSWNDWNGPHLCGKMYLEMILPGFWELHEKSFVCALHGLQEPMTNCWLRSCTLQANSSSTDHTLGQEVQTSVGALQVFKQCGKRETLKDETNTLYVAPSSLVWSELLRNAVGSSGGVCSLTWKNSWMMFAIFWACGWH